MRIGLPYGRRHIGAWFVPICLVLIFVFVVYRLQSAFMTALACYTNTIVTDRVNRAVYDAFNDDDVFESIEVYEDGKVSSLAANMPKINRLKAKTVVCVQDELGKITKGRVYVPLSAVLGIPMLGGTGVRIPVTVIPMTVVDDSFEESFDRTGINQTLYKLDINIKASMTYCCFNFSRTETINTLVPVISTIINGDVPSYYGLLSGTDAEVE